MIDQQTTITAQNGDGAETWIRPSAEFDYSETILARVMHNLPELKQGHTLLLHMFVPSENRTIAFEYFLDGETTLMGKSFTRVRARASNWLYNLFLPRIQFLVERDGSSIPVFFGPADFYRNKTRGVWIVNRNVDTFSLSPKTNGLSLAVSREGPDEK